MTMRRRVTTSRVTTSRVTASRVTTSRVTTSQVPVVQRVKIRSNVIRSLPRSSRLGELQDQLITLKCRGWVLNPILILSISSYPY